MNSALSKISLIRSGLMTPMPAVTRIRVATPNTVFLYGVKMLATRRRVTGLMGPASGSGSKLQ
jgi:hypothetical protein